MKFNKILIAFALLIGIAGCDVIDKPFEEKKGNDEPILTGVQKKIILEDYTGFTCPNCPKGAEAVHSLMETYSKSVIPIAVHAGYFAKPKSSASSPYKYDFRTDIGEEWDKFFGMSEAGNPCGLINRLNSHKIYSYQEWVAVIAEQQNKLADFEITLKSSLDEAANKINADVSIKTLDNLKEKYSLCVVLVQDNIVDYQDNGGTPIPEFVHNHVLRAGFNGAWGEAIITSPISKNEVIAKNYSLNIKNDTKHPWNRPHLKAIAFVYNTSTYEIMQAEEVVVK